MSDNILYNFGANHSSLADVSSNLSAVQEVRSDITNLFNVLSTVYEGAGATALNQAHQKIDSMLDDLLHSMSTTGQQAQEQQTLMQQLDNQNASAF